MPKNRDYTGLDRSPSSLTWLIRRRAELRGAIDYIDKQLESLPQQRREHVKSLKALDQVFPLHEVKVEPKKITGIQPRRPALFPHGALTRGDP